MGWFRHSGTRQPAEGSSEEERAESGREALAANPGLIQTRDEAIINRLDGFAAYRGEDLLALPQISRMVDSIRRALGGSPALFAEHIAPSLRVFAAYAQFLPASGEGRHHCEYLGLLVHSLQTALAALNLARNVNFNTGVDPDKRGATTAAAMIACCLCGLVHDAGKINDFKIITRAGSPRREIPYSFVNSIPEFLARAWGMNVRDVYIIPGNYSPENRLRTARLPRYEILGLRSGRADKHELIGNEKKHLFIQARTEQFIADASYQLYEEFHMFSYQGQLNEDYRFPNRIYDLVRKADQMSAAYWESTRKPEGASWPDLSGILKQGEPASENEGGGQPPAGGREGAAQGGQPADQAPEPTPMKAPIPSPAPSAPARQAEERIGAIRPTARRRLAKALQDAFYQGLLLNDSPGGAVFPLGYADKADGRRKLVFLLDANHPSVAKHLVAAVEKAGDGGDLFKDAGRPRSGPGAVAVYLDAGIFLRSNAPDGCVRARPFALYGREHDSDGVRTCAVVPADALAPEGSVFRQRFGEWMRRGAWFKDATELNFGISQEDAAKAVPPEACRSSVAEAGADKDQEKAGSAGGEQEAPAKPALPDHGVPLRPGTKNKPDIPSFGTGLTGAQILDMEMRRMQERDKARQELKERMAAAAAPEGMAKAPAAEDLPDADAPSADAGSAPAAGELAQLESEKKPAGFGGDGSFVESVIARRIEADKAGHAGPSVAPAEASAKARAAEAEREKKAAPVVIGEFAEDREDDRRLKEIANAQREYWCSREDYSKLNSLPPEAKEELRARHAANIRSLAGGDTPLFKGIMHEISLRARHGSSRFALVSISGGGHCYAAFLWDEAQKRNSQGKKMQEQLKNAGFFPLAPRPDGKRSFIQTRDETWAELYYFECMMLGPDITALMALDGDEWQQRKVRRTVYHSAERPPTTWSYVRLFQIEVLGTPQGRKLMGKYNVMGDPNYVRTVAEAAFKDFCGEAARRLAAEAGKEAGRGSFVPPSLSSLRSCLPMSRQKVPPYVWRPGEKSCIDDPDKPVSVLKISFWPPEGPGEEIQPKPRRFKDEVLRFSRDPQSPAPAQAVAAMMGPGKARELGFGDAGDGSGADAGPGKAGQKEKAGEE